jgi:septum formation protein
MRVLSEAFLDAYLAEEGETLLGTCGAYRVEGPGIHLFSRIEGEAGVIQGLPMLPLLQFLREQGAIPA